MKDTNQPSIFDFENFELQFNSKVQESFSSTFYEKMDQIDEPMEKEESIFDFLLHEEEHSNDCLSISQTFQSQINQKKKLQEINKKHQPQNFEQIKSSQVKTTNKSENAHKQGYPTKNFLVNFKKSHFDFLKNRLGKKFTKHRFIQRLIKKKGISMKEYQKIYTTEEFKEALQDYFNKRQIFRDMLCSKMDLKQKKLFLKRINVFEQSFRDGNFSHIN